MKVFTSFLAFICVLLAIATAALVTADGKNPEDFQCQICRDFVQRVVVENESPRTACKGRKNHRSIPALDGCFMILKEHKLVAKTFDLRAQKKKSLSNFELDDICNLNTKNEMCPHSSESYGPIKKLHADAAGLDIRVAPASSWMNPNSVRVTVIDQTNATKHSPSFLSNFSYNEQMKYYATQKVVHTGVFSVPQTGGRFNLTLGDNELVLPIKTIKPGQGIRAVLIGDPCSSSKFVTCSYGKEWKIIERLSGILNALASNDAVDMWTLLGDNWYDPLLEIAPQFFAQLNLEATSLPFLTTPGNHDYFQWGSCLGPIHIGRYNSLGSSYLQNFGQNSKYASHNPTSPFNWAGFDINNVTSYSTIPIDNVFTTTLLGNTAWISYSGMDTLESAMPYFEEACKWVSETKPAATFIHTHWSEQNCGCKPGMDVEAVWKRLTAMDGCSQVADKIFAVLGHSHNNEVQYYNTSSGTKGTPQNAKILRLGGFGMENVSPGPDFGIPYLNTNNGRVTVWYFPIAKDFLQNGDTQWKVLMDCVNMNKGLDKCTHLATLFLDVEI